MFVQQMILPNEFSTGIALVLEFWNLMTMLHFCYYYITLTGCGLGKD